MQVRASRISASIARAISGDAEAPLDRRLPDALIEAVVAFFAIYRLGLTRYRPADFLALRRDAWGLDEDAYASSFQAPAPRDERTRNGVELVPVGDLGYSGSSFFATPDGRFLVKSLPRRFEHEFFTRDLFPAYAAHMTAHPDSLLVRITDMAYAPGATLGGLLGTAPTHHVVMENLLCGRGHEDAAWETYDLKPDDYFFPERDVADGRLAPEGVKARLVDTFPDRVRVSAQTKRALVELLAADTRLLADANAVDYSLFLVRLPGPRASSRDAAAAVSPRGVQASPWRAGVDSADGQWTYRAVVLDFFWARHKARARAMSGLVAAFNLLADKGPMSITAQPGEYRARFMRMVDKVVLGVDEGGEQN